MTVVTSWDFADDDLHTALPRLWGIRVQVAVGSLLFARFSWRMLWFYCPFCCYAGIDGSGGVAGGRAGEFVNGTSGVSYLASNLIKTIKERIAMRFIVSNNST